MYPLYETYRYKPNAYYYYEDEDEYEGKVGLLWDAARLLDWLVYNFIEERYLEKHRGPSRSWGPEEKGKETILTVVKEDEETEGDGEIFVYLNAKVAEKFLFRVFGLRVFGISPETRRPKVQLSGKPLLLFRFKVKGTSIYADFSQELGSAVFSSSKTPGVEMTVSLRSYSWFHEPKKEGNRLENEGYLKLNMEDLSLEEEVVRARMIKQAKATLLLLWKQEPLLGEKAEKRLQVLFKDFMRKQGFALLQGVPGSRVVVGRSYDLIDDINLPREPFLFLGIGVSLGIERIDKPGESV